MFTAKSHTTSGVSKSLSLILSRNEKTNLTSPDISCSGSCCSVTCSLSSALQHQKNCASLQNLTQNQHAAFCVPRGGTSPPQHQPPMRCQQTVIHSELPAAPGSSQGRETPRGTLYLGYFCMTSDLCRNPQRWFSGKQLKNVLFDQPVPFHFLPYQSKDWP